MAESEMVLVIDDEEQIRRLLRISLEDKGFRVADAASGKAGLEILAGTRPDVVILDLGLPDLSGLEVLRAIRERSSVPVIILSVQGDEDDKVRALDAGADDYVTKPFGMGELLARIRAAQRHRSKGPATEVTSFRSAGLEIDFDKRIVKREGVEVHLTSTEYSLLKLLALNAGKVLTHRHILREVWGPNQEQDTHYLRIYVGALRKKIEADPNTPTLIVTEPGVGYRLKG